MYYDDVTAKVQDMMMQKRPLVVAVSGFGGSGKTTLAEKLHEHFQDSSLLQLDNFLVNHGEGDGWQGGYDWERFENVLKDIQAGKDLHYQWYNWDKDETKDWINQPLPPLVIVEGVRLFSPELMKYFDLTIWVDVYLEVATQRGKARDAANKSNDDPAEIAAHLAKWDEVWTPKEEEFLDLFKPSENADIRYEQDYERR